ncbi:hypothetical protein OIU83_02825 [Flavobacterium sp. LS1R49]|uniref:Uncharacterized protein n=1 Tax=Flavobacterium shii TaxID=2987687 RepID=A0A9X2Z973_9FLAO|nr:hypothetical protein [Flavobacterium shii]MCV9926566.1 hypothetical protein [Flavobacterium shii]
MDNLKKHNKPRLEFYQLSIQEITSIEKSEEDIKYGRLISQEDLDKEDLE